MAALALLLSTVGIFALVANLVTQKTREIGIRMALGSTIREAMVNVGAPGLRAAGLGLVLGLLACTGTLRVMRNVLYGVGFYDYPTILAVVATLVSVTLIAVVLPTLRIARIDPAETLREE
jgi:putative ABC transport system permease protein